MAHLMKIPALAATIEKTRQILTITRRANAYLLVAVTLLGGSLHGVAQTTDQPVNPLPMPPVTVTATNTLQEEAPMGPNQQPEWTARRPFGITRVYVQPPWQVETEFGWDAMYPRGGSPQ